MGRPKYSGSLCLLPIIRSTYFLYYKICFIENPEFPSKDKFVILNKWGSARFVRAVKNVVFKTLLIGECRSMVNTHWRKSLLILTQCLSLFLSSIFIFISLFLSFSLTIINTQIHILLSLLISLSFFPSFFSLSIHCSLFLSLSFHCFHFL